MENGFKSDFEYEVRTLGFHWLGIKDYEEALHLQNQYTGTVRTGQGGVVLFCEHEPVITLGKRSQSLSDILVSLDVLREKKIKIIATDRGGHGTFHNPGQLVIYPILPLKRWGLGVRIYVECLERATAYFFAEYGIEVTRAYEPGLWVNDKKIASFGIRVDRGVSLHGAALNINNDLLSFSLIKQCGMEVKVTSLISEMKDFMEEVPNLDFSQLARQWLELFQSELLTLKGKFLDLDATPDLPIQNKSPNWDRPLF